MMFKASSTDAYFMEHMVGVIPSLTLWPSGKDRSTISRYFPG